MDNPIIISLVVSGIGMLMLFLALVFLYGLMYLMTTLIKDRPEAGAGERDKVGVWEAPPNRVGTEEQGAMRRRAAVIAVALARAEQEQVIPPAVPPMGGEGAVNCWRALHHQRQLTLNNMHIRRTQ